MKYWIFFLLLLLTTGCGKNQQEQAKYYIYVDPRMNCFFFEKGSYWIYHNDSLNITDSTALKKVNHEFIDVYQGLNSHLIFELITMFYFDEMNPSGFSDGITGYYLERDLNKFQIKIVQNVLFSFDTNYHHIDSMEVKGNYYHDVQLSTINGNIYFTSPEVGLIKKIIYDSVSNAVPWDLIRYHVIITKNQ